MNNLTVLDLLAANAGPVPEWFEPLLSKEDIQAIEEKKEIIPLHVTDFNAIQCISERNDRFVKKMLDKERCLQWPYYYAARVLGKKRFLTGEM